MKGLYIMLLAALLCIQHVDAQHTKRAHKAARKVHREARKSVADHNKAVKLEKKKVNRHGV